MNILIIGGTIFARNRGVAAITRGCIDCIRNNFQSPRITLLHTFVESYYPIKTTIVENIRVLLDVKKKSYIYLLMDMVIHIFITIVWRMFRSLCINMRSLLYDELLKEYEKADVVINLSYGDMFAYKKDFYSKLLFVNLAYWCTLAILFKKTLVFYPQSIGPFNSKLSRFLARFILSQCKIVAVREKISKDYLIKMKINAPLCLVPDLSFILNPVSDQRVSEIILKEGIKIHRPLIGIALRDNLYPHLNEISKVINYLILNMDASIIFIPHFSSLDTSYYYYDPRFIARKLLEKIDSKEQITVIQGEYSVEELRGLIGKCDLFIGAYMHANISALSMCVPTIAISYSHKTHGIMDSVGLSESMLDVNELTATNLINKIEKMYNNIHEYREYLKRRIPIIREAVLKLGKLTPEL